MRGTSSCHCTATRGPVEPAPWHVQRPVELVARRATSMSTLGVLLALRHSLALPTLLPYLRVQPRTHL